MILQLACSGVKVRLPDAKKCTCRRKGVILTHARSCEKVQISEVMLDFACLLLACCLLVAIFELFCAVPGCENMHIPKERSDFAYCVLRRKSADIEGDVGFCLLACLLVAKCGF